MRQRRNPSLAAKLLHALFFRPAEIDGEKGLVMEEMTARSINKTEECNVVATQYFTFDGDTTCTCVGPSSPLKNV